uniref:WPP domain-interacting tail-anchored protein 1 n=2 Tax=Anthurium amnicola TaxID=1678845 RepID=A0A1D1ZAN5_9ARAE
MYASEGRHPHLLSIAVFFLFLMFGGKAAGRISNGIQNIQHKRKKVVMAVDDDHDDICLNEDILVYGEKLDETGSTWKILTRIELDLACCSEKVLNLHILLIHVTSRLSDYESLDMEYDSISPDAIDKAFEFDTLSGILDSELRELDKFMTSLSAEIVNVHLKTQSSEHSEVYEVEEKLQDAEESLKQLQEQVAEIRIQSTKFESTLALGRKETWNGEGGSFPENGHVSLMSNEWKMHTVEQQRHVLQTLEKSLARELDLEKKLSDSRHNEEELRLNLHLMERERLCIEEPIENIQERLFEAENVGEVLMGISKELMSKLQIVQFSLNSSKQRENEMRSKLQESLLKLSEQEITFQKLKTTSTGHDNFFLQQTNGLKPSFKEAEDRNVLANSEALTLKEKLNSLETKLKESDVQLQQAKTSVEISQDQQRLLRSKLTEMEHVVECLRENVATAERRAEDAEAKCMLLTETNLEINEELGLIRSSATEKEDLLERKLKESDARLEHAKASIEAIEEQQNMLYAALGDMENLIQDLKFKASKAESRAENAESKCTLLTETNLELNEELGLSRSRLEFLERSLHKVDEAKMATVKDIGIRTKVITELVMKLALERERLQVQISRLTKENQTLGERWWKRENNIFAASSHEIHENEKEFGFVESFEESVTESSTTNIQVENQAPAVCRTDMDMTVSPEDVTAAAANFDTVRSIEAGQLNSKHVAIAILVLVVSICGMYIFQQERCPF